MKLLLVAGLSRAGKSTFADRYCQDHPDAEHLPLDKYFRAVPAGTTFLEWVQHPRAIDWPTLLSHLDRLKTESVWTPCTPPVSRPRHVRGGADCYVIPGCLAFEAPVAAERIFVDTPLAVVAERLCGRPVDASEIEAILDEHLTPHWRRIHAYRERADRVVPGYNEDGRKLL